MNILLGHNTILAVAIPAAEWPIRASGLHGRSLFSVSLCVIGLYPGNQRNEKPPPVSLDPLITPMVGRRTNPAEPLGLSGQPLYVGCPARVIELPVREDRGQSFQC